MNRETKRAMARQQRPTPERNAQLQKIRQQDVARRRSGAHSATKVADRPRRARMAGASTFGSEVVGELKKVSWPKRSEVIDYTIVVLIAVIIITAIIFGLDTMFGKSALAVFG